MSGSLTGPVTGSITGSITGPITGPITGRSAAPTPTSPGPGGLDATWFNDPTRHPLAVLTRLAGRIHDTPAGATIRVACYSLSHPIVIGALIEAMDRGVIMLACLDGRNRHFPGARRLARSCHGDSTVVFTKGSARGPRGVTHAKFWAFSNDNTVLVGSSNCTRTSAYLQWSSLLLLPGQPLVYDWLVAHHATMMLDEVQPANTLAQDATFGTIDIRSCPRPGTTAATDPVMIMLDKIVTSQTGATLEGVTIRVAQHGFNESRALWVAHRLADLARQGAAVQVICGIGTGKQVPGILAAGGCRVRRGRRGARHIHWKHYAADWTTPDGVSHDMVSDGSENCSDQSLFRNDEVQLTLWDNPMLSTAWRSQFEHVWAWSRPL